MPQKPLTSGMIVDDNGNPITLKSGMVVDDNGIPVGGSIPAGDLGMKATVNGKPFLDQEPNPFTPGTNILRGAANATGTALKAAGSTVWEGIAPFIPGTDASKKVGQSIADGSFFVNLGKSLLSIDPEHTAQAQQMIDAAKAGDIKGAIHHTVGILPLLGPWMAGEMQKSGEGKIAESLGDVAGMGALMFGGQAMPKSVNIPGPFKNPNAAERATVDWGQSKGVPVDAATASGRGFVRGVQKIRG